MTLLVGLLAVVPGSADASQRSRVGGDVAFEDGSPASGIKATLFEAKDRWTRGPFLGSTKTKKDGRFSFGVKPGCYIIVTIAPDGTSFGGPDVGRKYDQQYGCVDPGGRNFGFDSVLYRPDAFDASVGGDIVFDNGDPAPDVRTTLFEARTPYTSGKFLGFTTTDAAGRFSYDVIAGCYIIVSIAPDGTSFGAVDAGQRFDQQYGCVDAGGSNLGFDSALFRPRPDDPCESVVPPTTIDRRSNLTIPADTATPQYTRPDASCVNEDVEVDLTSTVLVQVLAIDGPFAFVLPDGATAGTWIDLTAIGQNESINQFWTVGDGGVQEGQTIEYQLSANTTLPSMFYNLPVSIDFTGGRIGFYLGFQSRADETYVWTSAFKSGAADGNAAQVIEFEANGATCSERDDEPGIFDTVGCDTGFRWEPNTTYTLRWTIGEQVGTARWFRATIEGPGTQGVQLPAYLIETGAADSMVTVGSVTNFTEQFSGFEDCVPPASPTGADFGAPEIAGRSLSPASTNATWCVNATIVDSTVIPGGRLLQY
ncbi:MAG: hypothetical protein AAGA65_15055 [Actinomycetota bacterium]